MASLACRRTLVLTGNNNNTSAPPLLILSSSSPSSPSCRSPSSSIGAAAAAALPYDGRHGRISWRHLCSRSSSAFSRSHHHHHPNWSHRQQRVFSVPPALLRQTPTTADGHTAVPPAHARQLWRSQTTALNCERFFGSGFSQYTPNIQSGRFHFMATAGTKQSSGLATSSETRKGDPQKIVTFETRDGKSAVGIVHGDALWSLQDVLKSSSGKPLSEIGDVTSVIINWSDLKDRLILKGSGTKVSEVKLLAPIPRPTGVIMCIGKNYLDHVKEVDTWKTNPGITKPEAPKHPIVFTKAPQSVIGPGAAIKYPHGVSSAVDYEAELGVIIGKAGQKIKREDAMSHIFGYTIINDVTARDLQKRHQQWFLGKSCDTFCPMGPGIVPASEIDGNDLQIQCWVNDELRQDGRTSQMIFGIPELIEVISVAITLQPGDIIATGTPAGVGSGFQPPRHLSPGDKVRICIEGLGELCNTVE